ncbi:MAG: hypothetical protein M9934_08615 [Thermomicrobiales bacterium]|nr:hypothetical protein [Thermomicrobiales bacterium]MCO5228333.1 hypothetical protein [Thermomicrobiales bacterium]
MAASGHICGNCSKTVDANDITCPHCDALLAAYASPAGSVTAATEYSAPSYAAPPVVAEIIQTETAPEPLFDTHVTVEELAEAAELDHPVELLLAGVEIPHEPAQADTLPEPTYPRPIAEPAPVASIPDDVAPESDRVGETEAYLRKLHKQTRYKADSGNLSKPVQTRPQTRADREVNQAARNQAARKSTQPRPRQSGQAVPPIMKGIVGFLWISLIATTAFGEFSVPLFMLTIFLTWGMRQNVFSGRGRR